MLPTVCVSGGVQEGERGGARAAVCVQRGVDLVEIVQSGLHLREDGAHVEAHLAVDVTKDVELKRARAYSRWWGAGGGAARRKVEATIVRFAYYI